MITVLIGGIQGEGVVSAGTGLMKTMADIGYFSYSERKFSSRIKGGHTHMVMTFSSNEIRCVEDECDLVLALNEETINHNRNRLKKNGLILADDTLSLPDGHDDVLIPLPLTSLAKKMGSERMKNTAALAFAGRMIGVSFSHVSESVRDTFRHKNEEVLHQNNQLIEEIYALSLPQIKSHQALKVYPKIRAMLMTGNDAITLGALAAGCRFMAAYPITPASDVMENMVNLVKDDEGIVIQTEDEIAAVTMCIGASYAGMRSMTATSGPGLTLMMEGIGLAGMTETPLVVVDAQRSGPSTGMPTKTEQSDLAFLYYGGHGEFPMILLTPSTIEECFEITRHSFHLADEYQCPVLVLTDLSLSLSQAVIPELVFDSSKTQRPSFVTQKELDQSEEKYQRYAQTETGISPRSIPGMKNGLFQTTGLEHNGFGRPSDLPENRKQMMDKRRQKTEVLKDQDAIRVVETGKHNDFLCLTFGSTWGVLEQVSTETNIPADIGRISRIRPLPEKQIGRISQRYRKILVFEMNQEGQLASIFRNHLQSSDQLISVTKVDGTPFTLMEVKEAFERWCT